MQNDLKNFEQININRESERKKEQKNIILKSAAPIFISIRKKNVA